MLILYYDDTVAMIAATDGFVDLKNLLQSAVYSPQMRHGSWKGGPPKQFRELRLPLWWQDIETN